MPTFSVVIPAYQAASTIVRAVESVLNQTVQPFELIVCDDGSTDQLDEVLRPYEDRLGFFRKQNGGEGSAKDAVTRAASGDFVVLLDADDFFLPERLEAISELAIQRPDLDILTTDAFLEQDGRTIRRSYTPEWTFETVDQRQAILRRNFIFSSAAIRRESLLAAGGFNPNARFAADWELWIRMVLSGSRAGLIDEPLYVYRVGPTSLSAQRVRLVSGFLEALEAAQSFELSDREQRILRQTKGERERELLVLRLREALDGGTGVRGASAAVMSERGLPLRLRLKAGLALLSPGLARLGRRRRRQVIGAGGTVVTPAAAVRLVAYTDAREIGGAEISLGNLLAELPDEYLVTVIGVDSKVLETVAARRAGTAVRLVADVRRKYQVTKILRHVAALQRERPQIVHVSMNTPWACRFGILAALLVPRAKLVLVEQHLFPTDRVLQRALKRFAARRAAVHVAVGERSAREIERLSSLPAGSVRTIYNGRPDLFAPRALSEASTVRMIGSVGRLEQVKGYDVLLDALSLLPGVELTLVGDGPERSHLEAQAERLGISDRVTITGWDEDPRSQLAAFDVFVLPSRLESFPLAIVEAMLSGLPVVATDVGSVAEAVIDDVTGVLVPPENAAALAAAVRRLDDPDQRSRLGAAGRLRALRLFTSSAMAQAFDAAYREALGGP